MVHSPLGQFGVACLLLKQFLHRLRFVTSVSRCSSDNLRKVGHACSPCTYGHTGHACDDVFFFDFGGFEPRELIESERRRDVLAICDESSGFGEARLVALTFGILYPVDSSFVTG